MQARLTKRTVDAARPGEKDVFVWDLELKGFGLKVTPTGRRIFIVQYWSPAAARVRRRMTLGTFGALTVDQARNGATRILSRVALGEDPAAAATARRTASETTVRDVSVEYLEEVRAKMKARTADEYARLFKTYIVPRLGSQAIEDIALRDIAQLHLVHRQHPYQANRILQLLRTFFNWCETRGLRLRDSNPCRGVQPYPERSRERFLLPHEVARLGVALDTAERVGLPPAPRLRKKPRSVETAKHRPKNADTPSPANPFAVGAIRFLLLTGWREQEALTLRWADIDLERGAATLPDTKTGKSQRPLGQPALDLVQSLPRLVGSTFVFPGSRLGRPLVEIRRVWEAVRHAAQLADVRLHDLRHTVASFAVGSGYSLYLTGKLLGHARAETTQRYAHLGDDSRKAAADAVSGALAAALAGQVVPVVRFPNEVRGK